MHSSLMDIHTKAHLSYYILLLLLLQITSCTQKTTTRTCKSIIRPTSSQTGNTCIRTQQMKILKYVLLPRTGCLMNTIDATSLCVCVRVNTPECVGVFVCVFIKNLQICTVSEFSFLRHWSQGCSLQHSNYQTAGILPCRVKSTYSSVSDTSHI